MPEYDVLVVGAGLSGATIAEHLAREQGKRVLIIDKRPHLAGNVYDEIDPTSGIRVSRYGAHLFHTNDEEVWAYVQRFAEWKRWDHRVLIDVSGALIPMPITLETVNRLFDTNLTSADEMEAWLQKERAPLEGPPENSEEVALSKVGPNIYESVFKPYTFKQWGKWPKDLEPLVLERIPVRPSFDTRYFADRFQALPAAGYTAFVEAMLRHPNIEVRLNTPWSEELRSCAKTIVFTGPIDVYFAAAGLPKLEYRSIEFHWSWEKNTGYAQPNSVINYADPGTPFTRCVEYKHFLYQKSDWTVMAKETTCDDGEPYYPVPTKKNQELYERYKELAGAQRDVHFVGRLASYKYLNMDAAIRHAIDYYRAHLAAD
jgi:UDP-galactopyranose mutase